MRNAYLTLPGEQEVETWTAIEDNYRNHRIFEIGILTPTQNTQTTLPDTVGNKFVPVIALDSVVVRRIKRTVDISVSLLVIVLVFPWLIPLISILIKLDSRGPIFFLQKRNGQNGTSFTCIKFRSMRLNPESDITPAQLNDPRITHIGRTLRNYCIDELPQFLNVLRGDMTLVGPRPHMIEENRLYDKSIPNYALRFKVKPGITGLGQVYNEKQGTPLQRMKIRTYWDTVYILNWSVGLEVKILLRTLSFCFNAGNQVNQSAVHPQQ